jgi:hypothetical protein
MNEQQLHNQQQPIPSRPVMPQPPIQQPIIQKPQKKGFDLRYFFLALIVIGISGGLFAATRKTAPIPIPTPTDTPTPSPKTKSVVPLATQSAYLSLTQSIASLSSQIQQMQVSDTTLSPPTIELPLGFPNE